jgi:aspartate/methionine/tyrosine aminotransferase
VYNSGKDAAFDRFITAIYQQKMAEVCSATFPQVALPMIYEHPEFPAYLQERIDHYQRLAEIAHEELGKSKYLHMNKTAGTFYLPAIFKEGVLNNTQTLPTDKPAMKTYIESRLSERSELDKRFAYYLLASEGICTVPLTSFFAPINGFRITLLEKNVDKFANTMQRIAKATDMYVESTKA